ncbi:tRNA (adenosine(37)-N6)-threonylcarbamoyltransferase complex ATPase subunit type 1 TsaE [Porticoccaceae bacterium]|nr:tRNA (adenosine(37)-N6)-threonylcarbamoyltransferase complex ATPase subunit type 1 TsaE [Porticoccaceae bacterium]MDB3966975.1 tRNA (adenosine(37)-N6)-threonylcarbamoyltransferase complex ATPase subunit type 1 TsaE [Porticoccaceae bacterium]
MTEKLIGTTGVIDLPDEQAMVQFGGSIARLIRDRLIITLQGDLGAGKTTLSRGILQGLGHSGAVKSPTYTLVEPYQLALGAVYHFDLYRLVDAEELEYMGFADYLADAQLCLIEWPEQGQGFLPMADIAIEISQPGAGRCVTLCANSAVGQQLISQLGVG